MNTRSIMALLFLITVLFAETPLYFSGGVYMLDHNGTNSASYADTSYNSQKAPDISFNRPCVDRWGYLQAEDFNGTDSCVLPNCLDNHVLWFKLSCDSAVLLQSEALIYNNIYRHMLKLLITKTKVYYVWHPVFTGHIWDTTKDQITIISYKQDPCGWNMLGWRTGQPFFINGTRTGSCTQGTWGTLTIPPGFIGGIDDIYLGNWKDPATGDRDPHVTDSLWNLRPVVSVISTPKVILQTAAKKIGCYNILGQLAPASVQIIQGKTTLNIRRQYGQHHL